MYSVFNLFSFGLCPQNINGIAFSLKPATGYRLEIQVIMAKDLYSIENRRSYLNCQRENRCDIGITLSPTCCDI